MKTKSYKRGSTDVIPAMLSPHEAVLNRRAADLLGRDKIKKLNAKGNAMARYQGGTSDVNDRKALLSDIDNSFYGGGQAPPLPSPTPKPTPPRKYQFGTSNVQGFNNPQPAINFASGSPAAGIAPTFAGAPSAATGTPGNISVTANSQGFSSPFGNPVIDFRYADPSTLSRLNISDLIWSPGSGGYLTRADQNSNSIYERYNGGGGDPAANRRAAAYYNYIGSLPTRAAGTLALNQFYNQFGGAPPSGPSYNSILSNQFNNASPYMQNQFRQAGFGSTYTGPYSFGH